MIEILFKSQNMCRQRKIAGILFMVFSFCFFCGCGKVIADPAEAENVDEVECGKVLYPEVDISEADMDIKTCFVINTEALFFEPEDLLSSLHLSQDMELRYTNENIIQYINAEQEDCFLNAYIEDGKKVVIDYSNIEGRMFLQIKNSGILQDEAGEEAKNKAIADVEEFLGKLSSVCTDYILKECYYYNNETIQDYLKMQLEELKLEKDSEEAEIQILETQLQAAQDKKNSGYYMTFQAQAENRIVDSSIIQTGRGSVYKPPRITTCYIPNEGIVYVEIFHIRKPLEKTGICAAVSGEDALNYVKKMYNEYTIENSGIQFKKMELDYILLPLEKNEKKLQYVPAWIFYGTEYVYNDQGKLLFLQEKNVRINAVTGEEVF